jgi:hypothetical protein
MSESQSLAMPKTATQPQLKAVPQPHQTLPDGELVEAYLQSKGAPQMVASEVSDTIERAAKKVPSWVMYLISAIFIPLCMGIYAQYQTYKDLPSRMTTIETTQTNQGKQLDRIEDLLSPTSRPKE